MPSTLSSILEYILVVNSFCRIFSSILEGDFLDGNLLVERIRLLCRQNGTSLTKLETHLGFGNGAIGKWKRNKPPYERLQKVADYFGITVAELTGETLTNENKPATHEGRELTELQREALDYIRSQDDEDLKVFLAAYKAFIAAQKK